MEINKGMVKSQEKDTPWVKVDSQELQNHLDDVAVDGETVTGDEPSLNLLSLLKPTF